MGESAMQDGASAGRWPAGVVARRLGITPSTLRTWNHRYGVGPASHTPGRHRLYSDADVADLQAIQRIVAGGIPAKAAVAIVRRGAGPDAPGTLGAAPRRAPLRSSSAVEAAARRLDADALLRAFDSSLRELGALDTWGRLVRPALARLGQRVVDDGGCMDAELVLVRAATAALHRAARPEPDRGRRPVLLACVQGEQHDLGLEFLHLTLAERGVASRMLGRSVADSALRDAQGAVGPHVVVLSAHRAATARRGPAAQAAASAGVVVLVGPGWRGPAVTGHPVRADVTHVDDLVAAAETVTAAVLSGPQRVSATAASGSTTRKVKLSSR